MSDYDQISKQARTARIVRKTVTYALLTLWGIIVLFPFYWMILSSIKSYGSYNAESGASAASSRP